MLTCQKYQDYCYECEEFGDKHDCKNQMKQKLDFLLDIIQMPKEILEYVIKNNLKSKLKCSKKHFFQFSSYLYLLNNYSKSPCCDTCDTKFDELIHNNLNDYEYLELPLGMLVCKECNEHHCLICFKKSKTVLQQKMQYKLWNNESELQKINQLYDFSYQYIG